MYFLDFRMKRFIYIFLLFCLVACSESEFIQPELVLEGWIEDDGHPFVMIHNSYTSSEQYTSIQEVIEDKTIFWGKVTVSDDENSDVMTGRLDTTYLPPYYYFTVDIKGESGKTYAVEAEFEGQKVYATTTIPDRVGFDSITIERLNDDKGNVRLKGFLTDNDERDNYYVLFYRYRGEKQYINCFLGVVSDIEADENGLIQIPIYNNFSIHKLTNRDSNSRYFNEQDTIDLKLSAVDKMSYDIWKDISALSSTSSLPFMPIYKNIKTNIVGGKGYWCGYASSVYPLVLNKDTTYIYSKQ